MSRGPRNIRSNVKVPLSIGALPPVRFQPPDRLIGATAFSQDETVQGTLNLVRLLKSQRWVWDDLRAACALDADEGRPREPGHWELAAVAFVASGHVDIQPWLADTTDDLWRECGFSGKPTYKRAWRRLRELENICGAFLDATGAVVQRCRRHDKRVGAHVHTDSTEDETHAALVHDCEPGKCPRRGTGHKAGKGRAGRAKRPQRQSTDVFRETRQKLNEQSPENVSEADAGQPEKVEFVRERGRLVKRILTTSGCWYRTLDPDAGVRAYMGQRGATRFWHGYYNQKATDHFTGGVLFAGVYNASQQEYHAFDDVYDRVERIAGAKPETMTGDKGFSVASVFEKCTSNGTAPVFSWRPAGGDFKRHDKDTHDRHGVPRCKHCGGPSEFVRFSVNNGKPRLWFSCMIGATSDCAKDQTITCSKDWRLLVPLWRTDPLYHELKVSHGSYEAVHDWWRDRYKVAADHLGIRPKVRSIGWHRLRANVAALIEWLRIAHRQGWLGSARRHDGVEQRTSQSIGQRAADKLALFRARVGITQPYGAPAVAVGLGQSIPPSRRPRGTPTGQQVLDIG
jgi:hypothetical protein